MKKEERVVLKIFRKETAQFLFFEQKRVLKEKKELCLNVIMKYCYHCGTKLVEKYLENEGMIPYCETCKQYIFPIFSTACSMIVLNPTKDKILLIKQYGRDRYILVAGYVNKGEDAETTVKREVKEEMGLEVDEIEFNQSQYFAPSNTLMINFSCVAKSEKFTLNNEVDEAKWMSMDEVYEMIAKNSLAKSFLKHYLDKRNMGGR